MELTPTEQIILNNLRHGQEWNDELTAQWVAGGAVGALKALYEKGCITLHYEITEAGVLAVSD